MFKRKKKQNTQALSRVKGSVGHVDIPFLLLVIALLVFGLIMVASSSHVFALYKYGNSYYYIQRQAIFALIGIAIMIAIAFFDYHRFRKYAFPLLIISVILLIIVLIPIPGVSIKANGARRWLNFGIQFQPSEIAKFGIIVSFASYISANFKHMKEFKVGIFPLITMLGLVVGLVVLEPHLSGAILILAIGVIMMFVGGVPVKWFAGAIAAGVSALAGIVLFTPYMQSRIQMWLDPFSDPQGKGYQVIQSLYAIGSGGLFGLGLGQSRQKHLYIPEPQNDYIFSIALEELGFVGGVLILFLFIMLIWRGFKIAIHSRDKFGSLLVIGIISRVAVQTVLNIGVVTNALPSTGISLPFFSYGGTALVMLLFEMGVVLSVSRFSYMEKS